ncbi:hypothetical protein DEAC_c12710 [Desulfosporosinus acididurans]|uniref:Uncharacterized protein n=1 Tax=Desulfosporosinus acididurans TaxID=476652 RepID=A0A0J1FT11_9FIRM|nr:hypothetical protein [Desulfosporosinus acididurans]KLU66605.1 hypothetical protein DEAC_c12710 [Desulfosporosinus acididurans]
MYRLNSMQQKKVLDSFHKVVDTRNPELIGEDLFNHLNLNCNFSSHFTLEGFRDAYSGDHFQEFLNYFDRCSPQSQWLKAPEISREFAELNQKMVDYGSDHI